MKLQSLEDLFVDELKDLYSAESQIVKALPKLAKAASSSELQDAFRSHLEETKEHVERLQQIFDDIEISPKGKKCKGMAGLLAEGEEMINADTDSDAVRDAGLIAAAQRVEHYEIAAYGVACTFAKMLGNESAATRLHQTLDEEAKADRKLSDLAVNGINSEAAEADGEAKEPTSALGRSSRFRGNGKKAADQE
jgi:ferritin-like metal-binding protein YciE